MERTFKKTFYESEPFYKLHHIEGFNVGKAYSQTLHYDTDLTIVYFKKCCGYIKIEGKTYALNDGDIIFLNHDELHLVSIENNRYCERITLFAGMQIIKRFPSECKTLFDPFYNRTKGCGNHILSETVKKHGLDTDFQNILSYVKDNTPASKALAICKIIEILAKLSQIVLPDSSHSILPPSTNSLVNDVIKYLDTHFSENINCDDISQYFHLSKYHLTRIFKENTGVPLWDYVIRRRLLLFNDLVRKNFPLEDACYKSGFNNYSNFYRLYKKHFGITPLQFKNQILNEEH